MCKILKISRSTYYTYKETKTEKDMLNDIVIKIFNENQSVYGTRKIKVELSKLNHKVSRRHIARINANKTGWVSAYTVKKYPSTQRRSTYENISNIVDRAV
jgi:hypothetical protein